LAASVFEFLADSATSRPSRSSRKHPFRTRSASSFPCGSTCADDRKRFAPLRRSGHCTIRMERQRPTGPRRALAARSSRSCPRAVPVDPPGTPTCVETHVGASIAAACTMYQEAALEQQDERMTRTRFAWLGPQGASGSRTVREADGGARRRPRSSRPNHGPDCVAPLVRPGRGLLRRPCSLGSPRRTRFRDLGAPWAQHAAGWAVTRARRVGHAGAASSEVGQRRADPPRGRPGQEDGMTPCCAARTRFSLMSSVAVTWGPCECRSSPRPDVAGEPRPSRKAQLRRRAARRLQQ
jgi:hypothetical protein